MSRGQGRVYRRKGSVNWWLDYSVRGVRHFESSGTAKHKEAADLLRERIGQRKARTLVGNPEAVLLAEYAKSADGTHTLVGGLRAGLERYYEREGNRSLARVRQALDHLEQFLGAEARALDITKQRAGDYLAHRIGEGAARSTVRYEIAVLNTAFSVAVADELLTMRPMFKLPAVENTRDGFFEPADFAALVVELPDYLRPVIRFLRMTGWRKSEALGLTWDAVDWDDQAAEGADAPVPGPSACIRLIGRQTKSGKPRTFPFALAPELKALLLEQWQRRDGLFVFHRGGRRIGDFRKVWATACTKAGAEGRLVHDLRRTAAREYRRAGLSEGEIMKLCGWETRAMFDRYNIIDEADLAAAVAKRFGANETVARQSGAPPGPPPSLSSSAAISAA